MTLSSDLYASLIIRLEDEAIRYFVEHDDNENGHQTMIYLFSDGSTVAEEFVGEFDVVFDGEQPICAVSIGHAECSFDSAFLADYGYDTEDKQALADFLYDEFDFRTYLEDRGIVEENF